MFKKLVYMSGNPYWLLPEGTLQEVERQNGRIVDPVLFRTNKEQWNSSLSR